MAPLFLLSRVFALLRFKKRLQELGRGFLKVKLRYSPLSDSETYFTATLLVCVQWYFGTVVWQCTQLVLVRLNGRPKPKY